jgi:hypothetical protein
MGGQGVNWTYVTHDRDKGWALWCGNDASGSKKRVISWLRKDQLLQNDSASWSYLFGQL